MSFVEIVQELPRLNRRERRELALRLFEAEDEETTILTDCDQRADERFLMLDKMESEDGKTGAR